MKELFWMWLRQGFCIRALQRQLQKKEGTNEEGNRDL